MCVGRGEGHKLFCHSNMGGGGSKKISGETGGGGRRSLKFW